MIKPTLPSPAKLTESPASARLQDHLRSLQLTYLLENAVPAAEAAAQSGQGHLHFLQETSSLAKSPCARTAASSAGSVTPASP